MLCSPLLEKDLAGTEAYGLLCKRRGATKPASLLVPPPSRAKVVACFQAVFQGDHLGVEIATCAHRNLLISAGLLAPSEELLSTRPFPDSQVVQGLVIDDFYSVSLEHPATPPEDSAAVARLDCALEAYDQHRLLGSTEKNVRGADCSRVAGAELDSTPGTRSLGLVTAGAPRSKRLSLASISLSLAALPGTSPALHACLLGGWVSSFVYRRPLMAVFQKAFALCPASCSSAEASQVTSLPRSVADEFALAAALAPLAVSDLAACWDDRVFATDSSEEGAAIVCTPVSQSTTALIWRSSDKKGASTKLLSRAQAAVRKLDLGFEEPLFERPLGPGGSPDSFLDDLRLAEVRPNRPLGLRFHFLQVGGRGSLICDGLASRGWVVGPVLHLDFSPRYDLASHEFFLWLVHLLDSGAVDSLYLRPPSKFFSAAAWPLPCTSKKTYAHLDGPRVRLGKLLAQRALFLFHRACRVGALCMLEQPRGKPAGVRSCLASCLGPLLCAGGSHLCVYVWGPCESPASFPFPSPPRFGSGCALLWAPPPFFRC